MTDADGATFVLRDDGNCYYADEDAIAPLWKGKRFPMETCISGWVMLNKRPVAIDDIYQDPRIPADAYRPTFVRSLVMTPIRTIDPIGAIGCYWSVVRQPESWEIDLLQALADSTSVAMASLASIDEQVKNRTQDLEDAKNAIERLSFQDELTGLYNRRGFFTHAKRSHASHRSKGIQSFILFADADGLKQVNDTLGHKAGDEYLCGLADVLTTSFRDTDIVARIGGDEFCVFGACHDTDESSILKRFENRLADYNHSECGNHLPLSASVGIVLCSESGQEPLEDIIRTADQAMYEQKRARRR